MILDLTQYIDIKDSLEFKEFYNYVTTLNNKFDILKISDASITVGGNSGDNKIINELTKNETNITKDKGYIKDFYEAFKDYANEPFIDVNSSEAKMGRVVDVIDDLINKLNFSLDNFSVEEIKSEYLSPIIKKEINDYYYYVSVSDGQDDRIYIGDLTNGGINVNVNKVFIDLVDLINTKLNKPTNIFIYKEHIAFDYYTEFFKISLCYAPITSTLEGDKVVSLENRLIGKNFNLKELEEFIINSNFINYTNKIDVDALVYAHVTKDEIVQLNLYKRKFGTV